jgi:hypothetical protein
MAAPDEEIIVDALKTTLQVKALDCLRELFDDDDTDIDLKPNNPGLRLSTEEVRQRLECVIILLPLPCSE